MTPACRPRPGAVTRNHEQTSTIFEAYPCYKLPLQVHQLVRRDKRLHGASLQTEAGWARIWSQLRTMMLTIVKAEPLVILVKLADRLHNMRTAYALRPEKQRAIAEETLQARAALVFL